jgi:hypothetical protein
VQRRFRAAPMKLALLQKGLRDIDRKIELAELKAKAADIYSAMADLKMALVDARDEIDVKNKEISSVTAIR